MLSAFDKLWRLGPSAFVVKAILTALAGNILLLAFILLRRAYRKWYFAKRDARIFELRQKWDALISGEIPYANWRTKSFDRRIVETMVLDAFEAAAPDVSARLLKFLRDSGLIQKLVFEARELTGWRRMRALVALGRTRAPEAIPALSDGLRDRNLEIRLAALRGLGRTMAPQAAVEILAWVAEAGLCVPALPLQNALIQCSAERPQLLVPYVEQAEGSLREVLGRVLGEIATPSLAPDLLQFAQDELPELRAAAARAMSHSTVRLTFDVLTELAGDTIWFVRLRAIVSLGRLSDSRAIPVLLRGLTDAHRLVRLRAAEGLVELKTDMASVFAGVVATGDRYGLHAYLTALENADLKEHLEGELQTSMEISPQEKDRLREVLQTGTFTASSHTARESLAKQAASVS